MIDKAHAVERVGDVVSVGALLGWILSILPGVATILTVLWMTFRVMETEMFRALLFRGTRLITGRGFDIAKWRRIDDPPPSE